VDELIEMPREKVVVNTAYLTPLGQEHVVDVIVDAIGVAPVNAESLGTLGEIVHAKTAGNPYFVNQTIDHLIESKSVSVDQSTRQLTWNRAEVESMEIADNVAAMAAGKIDTLPPETLRALFVLSRVGGSADRTLVAAACQVTLEKADALLAPSLNAQIVSRDIATSGDSESRFGFTHHVFQDVFRDRVTVDDRAELQYRIGKFCLARYETGNATEGMNLMYAVDNLNEGVDCVPEHERALLGRINIEAGERSKRTLNYDKATQYFDAAMKTALKQPRLPSMIGRASVALAELEFLQGNADDALNLISVLIESASTDEDRAEAYLSRANIALQSGKFALAASDSLAGLRAIKRGIPERPSFWKTTRALRQIGKYGALKQVTLIFPRNTIPP